MWRQPVGITEISSPRSSEMTFWVRRAPPVPLIRELPWAGGGLTPGNMQGDTTKVENPVPASQAEGGRKRGGSFGE